MAQAPPVTQATSAGSSASSSAQAPPTTQAPSSSAHRFSLPPPPTAWTWELFDVPEETGCGW
eukprot:2305259-Alexandrium_andersonii.AAC.1